MLTDGLLIEALNNFVEKAGDQQALGHFRGNAARAQIEKFVFVDLTGSCAVGATDVVGEDFEAGHGVGFGVIA